MGNGSERPDDLADVRAFADDVHARDHRRGTHCAAELHREADFHDCTLVTVALSRSAATRCSKNPAGWMT